MCPRSGIGAGEGSALAKGAAVSGVLPVSSTLADGAGAGADAGAGAGAAVCAGCGRAEYRLSDRGSPTLADDPRERRCRLSPGSTSPPSHEPGSVNSVDGRGAAGTGAEDACAGSAARYLESDSPGRIIGSGDGWLSVPVSSSVGVDSTPYKAREGANPRGARGARRSRSPRPPLPPSRLRPLRSPRSRLRPRSSGGAGSPAWLLSASRLCRRSVACASISKVSPASASVVPNASGAAAQVVSRVKTQRLVHQAAGGLKGGHLA